ncbi:hypothetical protein PRIPAC_75044 [Pristionchus pacificus]|uniref:Uncharacterized protein n=1 Tax=Pristionchus pacificus TaxID=54126 RepID=A0A2A6CAM4_PRIPA|nr:hypothetical protein PRIPAC_75044 [Pristionchus pacificus]|eukprot:PDM75103.1 hypothetical protein PRIPAC_40484 [Pristionchus pacificus]
MSKTNKLLGFLTDAFSTSRPPEVNMERRVSRVDDVAAFNAGRRQSNVPLPPSGQPNMGRRLSLNITCGAQEIPTVVIPASNEQGARGRSGSICVPALTMNLGGRKKEEKEDDEEQNDEKGRRPPIGLSKRSMKNKETDQNRIVEEESETED